MYGPESSGKTTLSLHCIAEAQKQGGTVAFIDVEHALDPVYAQALGVDVDSLLVSQPDTGEQALEITEALVRSGAVDAIVVDSVAALVPKAEIEGEMGDSHVGLQARLMSQALRKLTGAISKSNCVAIFIIQLREKVGVMFGSPEITPGGRALKFYSSVRLDIRKGDAIKVNGEVIGTHTKVKVAKNKLAPPFKEAEFDIMYGKGISKEGEIVDLGVRADVIKKSGAWFSYGEKRLAQGRDKVKELFKNDPELAKEIEEKIMANVDKLAPIKSKSKAAKGKSKKQAIEEAEAEAEDESLSEEEYEEEITEGTVDVSSDDDDSDNDNDNAASAGAAENLDDLMLDIKM